MAWKRILVALPAALIMLCVHHSANAFPDKDITFIIPYSPGGGFDRTVRMVIPYMEKYLPKKVNIIPKNLPGAGGRKGISTMYRSKADGHTIGVFNMPGMAIPAIIGKEVAYDLDKVTWIGQLATGKYLMAVSSKSAIKSVKDLKNLGRPVKFTATGPGSTAYATIGIATHVMNINLKYLTGYKGSKNYILGVIRGDGDAMVAPETSLRKFIEAGDVRPIVSFQPKSPIAGVPTAGKLGYPELESLGLARLVGAPPGVPADRQKILTDALLKAMADPELVAKTKKSKRPFAPLNAKQTKAAVGEMLKFYLKYKPQLGSK